MHETLAVRAAGIWEWAVRESASDENRIFLGLPCVNSFPTSYIPLNEGSPTPLHYPLVACRLCGTLSVSAVMHGALACLAGRLTWLWVFWGGSSGASLKLR